jgi:hypothetical protein
MKSILSKEEVTLHRAGSFCSFRAQQRTRCTHTTLPLAAFPSVSFKGPLMTPSPSSTRQGTERRFGLAVCRLIKQPLTNPCRGRHDERI